MWNDGHNAYMESRILSADPIELVNLLYQACTGAVREARHHLGKGEIGERSRKINKAYEILTELSVSLDHQKGGKISQQLGRLYDYMQGRLLEANMQQADAPLAETLGLLSTISEAWASMPRTGKPEVQPESRWAQPLPQQAAPAYAAQSAWSF